MMNNEHNPNSSWYSSKYTEIHIMRNTGGGERKNWEKFNTWKTMAEKLLN